MEKKTLKNDGEDKAESEFPWYELTKNQVYNLGASRKR